MDDTPPACSADRVEGNCNGIRAPGAKGECERTTWSVRFHVRDVGTGLDTVSKQSSAANGTFQLEVDPFRTGSNSTVSGIYSTTCCFPDVVILATDVAGNLGTCSIVGVAHFVSIADQPVTRS